MNELENIEISYENELKKMSDRYKQELALKDNGIVEIYTEIIDGWSGCIGKYNMNFFQEMYIKYETTRVYHFFSTPKIDINNEYVKRYRNNCNKCKNMNIKCLLPIRFKSINPKIIKVNKECILDLCPYHLFN